ncbi:MAG TPA: adenine deaminase, partial [Rhodospirillales bacterium]|nr:adenine deaminase [Rhodospirillales bacterium]
MGGATAAELRRRVDQALGREPADLVVRDCRLLDTATGAIRRCDIAVCGEVVVALGEGLSGRRVIEARGRFAVPGFVDTHVHVESSMVTPEAFERAVLPRGTTTAVCDPHEIANVIGAEGIRYFQRASESLHMRLHVNLSSCVPATELETAGARLEVGDLL